MKSVLFDLDGTIADTEILKAKALALATNEFGGRTTSPEIYKSVMGQSWSAVTDYFFEQSGVKTALESFDPRFRQHYSYLIENELEEKSGAKEFLHLLKNQNYSLALVSSAAAWMIEKVLVKLELKNIFDVIVSGSDTQQHKPHPESYLIALKKLNVAAEEAVAFEDSESGFAAAHAAGIRVIGVKHAFNQRHDFSLADKVIESFAECGSNF